MAPQPQQSYLIYKKSRFSTRLPLQRRYTASHFWILETTSGQQRVGLTKFATRMLGELVEMGVEVSPGEKVAVGQVIGWIECLKAASDLYCMVNGNFKGTNLELERDPALMQKDPYGRGWLYEVAGEPEPESTDAQGYADILTTVISKMLGEKT